MRRKDREVTNPEEIESILRRCRVCRIAMQDEEGLYILPLSYGYEMDNGRLTLYFHGAKEGRKISAIEKNSAVAFEMDLGGEPFGKEAPCSYGCLFESIIGTGNAVIVTDSAEKIHGLQIIMRHQTGKEFNFTDAMASSVAVIRIDAKRYSAKARRQ